MGRFWKSSAGIVLNLGVGLWDLSPKECVPVRVNWQWLLSYLDYSSAGPQIVSGQGLVTNSGFSLMSPGESSWFLYQWGFFDDKQTKLTLANLSPK